MGFLQQNGNINDIPVSLYWTIGAHQSNYETVQEIVVDADGNKLDADGNVVPMVNGQYPAAVVFGYQFNEMVKCTIIFHAYLSKTEGDEWEKIQKPPRDTRTFKFSERKDSMAVFAGTVLDRLYNHPLLQAQIPDDWIPDNI